MFADQIVFHQEIISLILTTFSLDYVLILLGENWLWSLLGLKRLNVMNWGWLYFVLVEGVGGGGILLGYTCHERWVWAVVLLLRGIIVPWQESITSDLWNVIGSFDLLKRKFCYSEKMYKNNVQSRGWRCLHATSLSYLISGVCMFFRKLFTGQLIPQTSFHHHKWFPDLPTMQLQKVQ